MTKVKIYCKWCGWVFNHEADCPDMPIEETPVVESTIPLNTKQAKLLVMVIDRFPKYNDMSAEDKEAIQRRVAAIKELELIEPEQIDIDYEFNDYFYPPQKNFLVAPVSYLDTKNAYWSNRKAELLGAFGNVGETIEGVLAEGLMAKINQGASYFDPVLCETIIDWFCPVGGRVLNPFCGEASIGLIAGAMNCPFVGVDIRQEQVDINNATAAKAKFDTKPKFICGNSLNLDTILANNNVQPGFDLVFSSPPYYDLEIYSDIADDLSTKQSYEQFMADYKTIFAKAASALKDNRFLVVKVGEIRDEKGIYRNFVGDNIRVMTELGLKYYNEIILLNQFGTAPMRFNQNFRTRKIVKLHQNILVFFKGDPATIQKEFGEERNKLVLPSDNRKQATLW